MTEDWMPNDPFANPEDPAAREREQRRLEREEKRRKREEKQAEKDAGGGSGDDSPSQQRGGSVESSPGPPLGRGVLG
jgi:hypothetical protein